MISGPYCTILHLQAGVINQTNRGTNLPPSEAKCSMLNDTSNATDRVFVVIPKLRETFYQQTFIIESLGRLNTLNLIFQKVAKLEGLNTVIAWFKANTNCDMIICFSFYYFNS